MSTASGENEKNNGGVYGFEGKNAQQFCRAQAKLYASRARGVQLRLPRRICGIQSSAEGARFIDGCAVWLRTRAVCP